MDLLGSERRAHFAESLQEVFVSDGGGLHVFLLQCQQGSLESRGRDCINNPEDLYEYVI